MGRNNMAEDVSERLAAIRARCEAATPAPWNWDVEDETSMCLGTEHLEAFEGAVLVVERCETCRRQHPEYAPCGWPNHADAAFIAHSREDVPWLLAENERLRAICRKALSEVRLGCSHSVEKDYRQADEHFETAERALRAALGEDEDDAE